MIPIVIIGFISLGVTATAKSTGVSILTVIMMYVLSISWGLQYLGLSEVAASDIALISVFALVACFIFWIIFSVIGYYSVRMSNGGTNPSLDQEDKIFARALLLALIPTLVCILYWISLPGGA